MKIKQPTITATLAAGSTASPYTYMCNITQQLCYNTCADTVPVFAPIFTVKSIATATTGVYVATIEVSGIVSYVKCGGSCACCTQQPINAEFTLAFVSSTTPTAVEVTASLVNNTLSTSACSDCSRVFVCEVPLTLTITS